MFDKKKKTTQNKTSKNKQTNKQDYTIRARAQAHHPRKQTRLKKKQLKKNQLQKKQKL